MKLLTRLRRVWMEWREDRVSQAYINNLTRAEIAEEYLRVVVKEDPSPARVSSYTKTAPS